jgi:PAS domain S-box-containing protein
MWLMSLTGQSLPYVTFYPAILLTAWYGGLGPGLFSAALSLVLLFPTVSVTSGDGLGLGLFGTVGAVTAWMVQSLQNANRRAEANAALALERLRRLEQHIQSSAVTLASIQDGVVSTDAAGRVTYMNAVAESLTKCSLIEGLGKRLGDVVPVMDEPTGQGLSRKILLAKDGTQMPVDHSLAPIRDQNGNRIGAVLVLRDISDKKRVESERDRLMSELLESKALLDTFFEKAPIGLAFWDTQLRFVKLNQALAETNGIPAEGHLGKNISELLPGLSPEVPDLLRRVMETGESIRSLEVAGQTPAASGRARWWSASYYPIRIGDATVGVGGVVEEITERKRVERELRESEERFRTMADSAPVLIWMAGAARNFTFFNKPWLEFTGTTLEEEIRGSWARRVHPDDLARCLETYSESDNARREFHMEYRLLRHDGQYRWVIDHGVPRFTPAGEFAGYIGSCIDITDRKESEDALRRSNEDLKEFAYAASHDLQQPLRTMSVYSQILQANYQSKLDDRADLFLTGIMNGSRAMSNLVRDLRAFVEAGDDDSGMEPVDCGQALQAAVANHRGAVSETGAVITSAALPVVCAQQARVVQLFDNVLGNALKYRSAAPPRIDVGAERQGPNWVLSFRDNGIGIDPKYHKRVFGLFKKLHGDEYPGTGIGLAICSRIVERYGCRIWLESARGKGSTFNFTLPAGRTEK